AASLCARQEEFAPALVAEGGNQVVLLVEVNEQTHRLAVTAPARQFRRIERIESAVGGEQQALRGGLGRERKAKCILGLEREPAQSGDRALEGTDPAFLRHDDGDRLALDQRLLDGRLVMLGRLRKASTALAKLGLRPELLAHRLDLFGDLLPLLVFGADQALE